MEDQLSYIKFLRWLEDFAFDEDESYKFDYMIRKINEFIPESDIEIFYPKYLFVENNDTELLFFTENKLFLITGTENKVFSSVFKLKDVIDFNFEVDSTQSFENVTLNIYFTLDRHLVLNSQIDTNKSYRHSFSTKIKAVYKKLLNL